MTKNLRTILISIGFIIVGIIITTMLLKEEFGSTSPGTLLQLSAGHVPSEEDEAEAKQWFKQVRFDLIDMTGSA